MRSLFFWMGLLVFLGSGNVFLSLALLLLALLAPWLLPAQGRRTGWFRLGRLKKKKDVVALHHEQIMDVSHSRRFEQVLNSNLHFLAPLPEPEARTLLSEAAKAATAGNRSASLAKTVTGLWPEATEDEIDVLSETAIRKVQAALTQTRSERLECNWYIWRTCQDERVRRAHSRLEGVVCCFLDPPHPELLADETDLGAYNPGESRECRCYAEPILDPGFENWPKLAVVDGQLVRIELRDFKALCDLGLPAKSL